MKGIFIQLSPNPTAPPLPDFPKSTGQEPTDKTELDYLSGPSANSDIPVHF